MDQARQAARPRPAIGTVLLPTLASWHGIGMGCERPKPNLCRSDNLTPSLCLGEMSRVRGGKKKQVDTLVGIRSSDRMLSDATKGDYFLYVLRRLAVSLSNYAVWTDNESSEGQ